MNFLASRMEEARSRHYRAFQGFEQAKFGYSGFGFSLSQFTPLPQQALEMTFDSKVVKKDSKIIISIVTLNP